MLVETSDAKFAGGCCRGESGFGCRQLCSSALVCQWVETKLQQLLHCRSGPIKQGLSQWGMAQYGLLLQNCRKRQEKTEKDRKRQKEPERDRKRQKETKTDRKSSIQHMSSHVRSCCNMPANGRSTVVNGIILFKAVAWHRSHAFNSITRFKSRASQSEGC